ncbi:hypothetical protein HPP92_010894 [Vanilla planifolia]|uniref:Uncharacterized protein n=1 Tax=Vanilla planifolia TaxID=51239 RepID=A0A835QZW4_VANPL|nr:hypothetical protein HPP92_010894 [Vanilla planifolia]
MVGPSPNAFLLKAVLQILSHKYEAPQYKRKPHSTSSLTEKRSNMALQGCLPWSSQPSSKQRNPLTKKRKD